MNDVGLAAFRVLDGEEIDVLANDCKLVQDSDGNGQVILKFKCVSSNAYLQTLKYKVIGR